MLPTMKWLTILILVSSTIDMVYLSSAPVSQHEKETLKNIVLEMFDHAYGAYKEYAYPADELMPISCKGRYRGSEIDRGDIDEALGNFSLTLIDTLDTLAVLGKLDEFETQVKYVIMNVSFNADAVVSVFETNIRVLGGLLGAHSMAVSLKESGKSMLWYNGELLPKAIDVADRLLPAFNTSTGIPYPKVNLRYGVHNPNSRVGHETDTCTACAGTMIMEFAALSRLTGKTIYEEKAHKAMEALWKYRSRHSDLVGTTINIHSGDWTRRDSGVGAGIDSYYEYLLKAYILLGDDTYLEKFNKHYSAIKRYLRQGYIFVDVMMHQPEQQIRSHVDSLQAFMPGLQVLKGDLQSAIEMHEILYTVAKKFKFLPEAFTTNLDVHWGQHPLRPEFVESTYFLYQATKDPYYLTVGKHVIEALEQHARVPCGYAALKDLRTLSHEDKMDSFVLAETFKYLYLLFSEESEHAINIHDFIFTTEAHLLPLSLSVVSSSQFNKTEAIGKSIKPDFIEKELEEEEEENNSCRRPMHESNVELRSFAEYTRKQVTTTVNDHPPPSCKPTPNFASMVKKTAENFLLKFHLKRPRKLKAEEFIITNEKHLEILKELGITLSKEQNGKVQLIHQAALANSPEDAEEGIKFMQEMVQLAKTKGENFLGELQTRVVQILSPPFNGKTVLPAGSAQFGVDLSLSENGVFGDTIEADPFNACQYVRNGHHFVSRIVLIQRGECMFIDKVRLAQQLGAIGVIIVDHIEGTSAENSQPFGMSGDSNPSNVKIPSVFLFKKEGDLLRKHIKDEGGSVQVRIGGKAINRFEPENIKILNQPSDGEIHNEESKEPTTSSSAQNELPVGDISSKPGVSSSQTIIVEDDGSKVITTISSYIAPDEKGMEKRHIQKLIQRCPTAECNEGVTYKMQSYQEDSPSKRNEPFSEETRESIDRSVAAEETISEKLGSDEQHPTHSKPLMDMSEMFNPDYSQAMEIDKSISKVLEESLKNSLPESSEEHDEEVSKCGFPGCKVIESKIISVNDLLKQNIEQLGNSMEVKYPSLTLEKVENLKAKNLWNNNAKDGDDSSDTGGGIDDSNEGLNSRKIDNKVGLEDVESFIFKDPWEKRDEKGNDMEAKDGASNIKNTIIEGAGDVFASDANQVDNESSDDDIISEADEMEIKKSDEIIEEKIEKKELLDDLKSNERNLETSHDKELDENENEDILRIASNENISRTKSEL